MTGPGPAAQTPPKGPLAKGPDAGRWRGRVLALALCAPLFAGIPVGAVAQGMGDPRLQAQTEDYRRTVGEGALLGAAAGAAIGGIIGATQGGSSAATGALVGALAGGLLGTMGGTAVANQKAQYAAREDQLDRAIAQARAGNAKLAALNGTASRLVETRRAEVARLTTQGGADAGGRARLAAKLQAEAATLSDAIGAARQERDVLQRNVQTFRGAPGSGALAGQVGTVDRNIAGLEKSRGELVRMREGL